MGLRKVGNSTLTKRILSGLLGGVGSAAQLEGLLAEDQEDFPGEGPEGPGIPDFLDPAQAEFDVGLPSSPPPELTADSGFVDESGVDIQELLRLMQQLGINLPGRV